MKKERTYRRFNLLAFLAILGCIGMLAFEGFFIFELYDRIELLPEPLIPAESETETIPENPPKEAVAAPVKESFAPARRGVVPAKKVVTPIKEVTAPVKEVVAPIKKEEPKPVEAPVEVKPVAPVTPAVLPVDDSPGINVEPVKEPVEARAEPVEAPSAEVHSGPVLILE